MSHIRILDCTLRDGGYCNQWMFGYKNIKKIINGLSDAHADIIECGFLTNRITYNKDITKYTSIKNVSDLISDRYDKDFVVMMNYGEFDPHDLPEYNGSSINGIRVAFHKKDMANALEECKVIKDKGYKVYIQAMVTLSYSDSEFLELIKKVNDLEPYIFYIVDSFGMMKNKDLTRLFYIVEHNLSKNILIGFHSHNNMQLAFSNAQHLTDIHSDREIVIDTSVYGMGRGAGNLNTELFMQYLNENLDTDYKVKPLLNIIDEILAGFYERNRWGYSLPNYLSAMYNTHPNYAGYLDDKKTLTIENMDEIFRIMSDEKRTEFDKEYIEKIYLEYMENNKVWEESTSEIKDMFNGKKVLIVAPGKSSVTEKYNIISFAEKNETIVLSVNFEYKYIKTDFIFFSNMRRFREQKPENTKKCIVTSNIPAFDVYFRVNYRNLLIEEESVMDNAGLMAVKFLMNCSVAEIYLAGFDGYAHNAEENYGDSKMILSTRNDVLNEINVGMRKVLNNYAKKVKISFVTEPKNITIE